MNEHKTEEDLYAELTSGDAYEAYKRGGDPAPADPVQPEAAKPEVKEDAPVAPAQSADEPARGPDGRFVEKAAAEKDPAKPASGQPFEGFDSLPDGIKAQVNRLIGERDEYKVNYKRQWSQVAPLQRQIEQLRRQVQAQGTPSGQPRAIKPAKLDRWEQHAKDFPDDAAALEERINAVKHELATGFAPIEQKLQRLEALEAFVQDIQNERAQAHMERVQSDLNQVDPDWKYWAGWVDESGRAVPAEKRDWNPLFRAWVEHYEPEVQEHIWATLKSPSPRVVGKVFADFRRDYEAASAAIKAGSSPPTDPVADRRKDALSDVNPNATPRAQAAASSAGGVVTDEDRYAAALAEGWAAYRKA